MSANELTETARRTVRVMSKNLTTAGVLLRDEVLDADGKTVSVLGCKSGILGRNVGEIVLIALTDNVLVPATITHIHAVHDRFRAAVKVAHLPANLPVGATTEIGGVHEPAERVEVVDPR